MKKSILDDLYEAIILNSQNKFEEIENNRSTEVSETRTIFSTEQKEQSLLKNINQINIQKELSFLTPFFEGPYFIFTSKILATKEVTDIPIDWSFSFDSNVGEKIRGFMNNENIDKTNKERIIKLLIFIKEKNVNFDLLPFVLENIRLSREDITNLRPFNTIAAFKAINYIDWTKSCFLENEVVLKKSWNEINKEALDIFNYYLSSNLIQDIELKSLFTHTFLLKLTYEYLTNKDSISRAFNNMIKFCLYKLNKIPLFELWLAWEFFNQPQKFRFFGPIAGLSKKLFKDISGMAWDLTHIRTMEQMATTTCFGAFYLPFFVSFDSKFSELLQQTSIFAMLIDDKFGQVVSIRNNEIAFHTIINEHIEEDLRQEFTPEKIHRRRNGKLFNHREYTELILELQENIYKII